MLRRAPIVLTLFLTLVISMTLSIAGTAAPVGGADAERAKAKGKPSLSASPKRPLQGNTVKLRTTLPTKFKRKVTLQRQSGKKWKSVARKSTKPSGKVRFKVSVPVDVKFRVKAKAVRHSGRRFPAVTTKTRSVRVTLRAELASQTASGTAGNAESGSSDVSDDGRYVVFSSEATDLMSGVSGYAPGNAQIFLRDRKTGSVVLVSAAAPGVAANGSSIWPRISGNGRHVVFASSASNLVANDNAGFQDIFRWDRVSGSLVRISVAGAGGDANASSHDPSISADGELIAFSTQASNIDGDDTNGLSDIYLWDANTGECDRISRDAAGNDPNGASFSGVVSANGAYITYSSAASDLSFNDDNSAVDVFRVKRTGGLPAVVSRGVGGSGDAAASTGPAASSANGRYVAFASLADNLVPGGSPDNGKLNVFVRDMTTQTTVLVSSKPGGGPTGDHSLPPGWVSNDGRFVVFTSLAPDLVAGDTNSSADVFVWDRSKARSKMLVTNRASGLPNGPIFEPRVTPDMRWMVFYSTAGNLVRRDSNGLLDSFVWRLK